MSLWHTHLLDRLSTGVGEVLDGALGVYGTRPTAHLAIGSRLDGYAPAALDGSLQAGEAVRLRTLRGSGFLIPRRHLPVTQGATRGHNVRAVKGMLRGRLQADGYEVWAARIEDLLTGRCLGVREIRQELGAGADGPVIRTVVAAMAAENRLVSVPVPGSWRSDAQAFARWDDRLAGVDVWSLPQTEAAARLAGLYLDRYGPATTQDLAWWSGLGVRASAAAAAQVAVPVDVDGAAMWSTGDRGVDPPLGVRLLGVWDPLLVGYRDRRRFVAPDRLAYVFDASGNATSTILIDGSVAGVWDLGGDDERMHIGVAAFGDFDAVVWRGIRVEARRIGDLAGASEVSVEDRGSPVRLTDASRSRFLRPLGE